MLKKLAFLLAVSAICSVLSVFGQKERRGEEPAPKQETRVERPVENPKPEPKQEPRPEPPRERELPRPVSTPRSEPRQAENPTRERPNNRPNPKDRDPKSEPQRPRRPRDIDDNSDRPKKPERPPVNNPNPPVVNPNPPNVDNKGKNKDKDKDRDRDRNNRRDRNGGRGGYPYPSSSPTIIVSNPSPPFSMRDYFDKDDVFFDVYNSYIEKPENYLPFFEDSPSLAFQPLYYAYGRKFFNNEFPWVSDDWTVYYEPDLDDIFVDFTTFGTVKYERMVLYPIGESIKKVNKKFEYKGSVIRPVLVEKIPDLEQDKVYSFNVHDLPKGDYELRFIAKDGATVKHSIRIK